MSELFRIYTEIAALMAAYFYGRIEVQEPEQEWGLNACIAVAAGAVWPVIIAHSVRTMLRRLRP